MNLSIRIKLTIQFAFIVMFILIFFSGSVYYFSSEFRQAEFYTRLENKALNTAKLLFEVKEVDYDLLKIIDRNTINSLYKENSSFSISTENKSIIALMMILWIWILCFLKR